MASIPSIQTFCLTLRSFTPQDAPILHCINQREGVLRYFPDPAPPSLDRVERFVAYQQKHWDQYGYGNWAIVPNGKAEIAGWAGLQYLPELKETEVGYLLDAPWWGRGFATEAARASLQFGFDHFDLPHIIGLVHPDNMASRRVLEKCGMVYQETLAIWGTQLMRYTVRRDAFCA